MVSGASLLVVATASGKAPASFNECPSRNLDTNEQDKAMRRNGWRKLAVVIWMTWIIGCAGGISEQARSRVTYAGSFGALQQAPDQAAGEVVMLGGKIIEIQNFGDRTELMVLQLALGASQRPADTDSSDGRFLLRSKSFIDPAIYPPGTLITVVGRVQGSEVRLIGERPYRYPVIMPEEIKRWPPRTDRWPGFHFGIGVGTTF
jgi:outer membrane lipoprotein